MRKVREAVARGRDPQGPSTVGSMCHGSPGCDLPCPGWSVMGLVFFPGCSDGFVSIGGWVLPHGSPICMTSSSTAKTDPPLLCKCRECRKPITIHLTLPRKSLPLAEGKSIWIDCAVSSWRAGEGQPPHLLSHGRWEANRPPWSPSPPGETWGSWSWWARVELAVVDGEGSLGADGRSSRAGLQCQLRGCREGRAGVGGAELGIGVGGPTPSPIIGLCLFSW